jgi:DNA (cytosine-5)-methyltransferase 1
MNDFSPNARDTLRANFADARVDVRDIRAIRPEEVLSALGMSVGDLDLLEGSPPCSTSFSTASNNATAGRRKDWGAVRRNSGTNQRADDLFFEWARVLAGVMPRAFVAENVAGLAKGAAFGYLKLVVERLESVGYLVGAKILDAQWLGVPQARPRLVLVGIRRDVASARGMGTKDVPFPAPLDYRYTTRDALPYLASLLHDTSGTRGAGEVIDRPCPTITVGVNSVNAYHFRALGPEPVDVGPAPWDINAARAAHEYALSFKARASRLIKGSERRMLSPREIKRLFALPDDFVLVGSYAQQWERVGGSTPPRVMAAIARRIRDEVLT